MEEKCENTIQASVWKLKSKSPKALYGNGKLGQVSFLLLDPESLLV